ncbi:MAG: hypothetical protein DRO94_05020 [Candidatus Altiarchaeales archaeon]|nr:MAG: hypothetical protein DRO95_06105 [Candidatus Altiarchaeales archaeon]RLI93504.1 MAG: hypothetical protein DRO94_05020 [Candidatus Altiarchaeales archaeon]HDO82249.1 DUF1616 domain-containing protein [Candidatus Altiarchaeales archaeon]HEX54898.1 DUF1616 domain-containing protein [Candidatus Altiarchaeales archaeon]
MILSLLRIIFGFALTLFIPGFAMTLVIFPRIGLIERMAFSSVLSICTVMLTALFLDLVLGIDITASNMVIALLSITALFLVIWVIMNRKLIIENLKRIKERKWRE